MKVFISHSSKDQDLAARVVSSLEKSGLDVWYDKREILPGDNWADKIAQGLRESDAMVVLLTPSALESDSVNWDIDFAPGFPGYSTICKRSQFQRMVLRTKNLTGLLIC